MLKYTEGFDKGLFYFMHRPDYKEIREHLNDVTNSAYLTGWGNAMICAEENKTGIELTDKEFMDKWAEFAAYVASREQCMEEHRREIEERMIIEKGARAIRELCDPQTMKALRTAELEKRDKMKTCFSGCDGLDELEGYIHEIWEAAKRVPGLMAVIESMKD